MPRTPRRSWARRNDMSRCGAGARARGALFDATAVKSSARVAIIGQTVANQLFKDEDPIGSDIQIGSVPFRVIGVLEPWGTDPHGMDRDNEIVVPISTLMRRLTNVDTITGAKLVVARTANEDAMVKAIRGVLRGRHGLSADQPDDFSILTASEVRQMMAVIERILSLYLPMVAGISLLVGGIVAASLMVASVNERAGGDWLAPRGRRAHRRHPAAVPHRDSGDDSCRRRRRNRAGICAGADERDADCISTAWRRGARHCWGLPPPSWWAWLPACCPRNARHACRRSMRCDESCCAASEFPRALCLRTRLRAALALASIAVSVGAVVVVSAIGTGAKKEILRQTESMGTNLLVVRPAQVKNFAARKQIRGVVSTLTRTRRRGHP